ncbi:MAG TPA: Xaa-Pro peptidase family protein [Polyangia bacterium]|nr:Xaa-Pro peptidase family protein [Polyangia bacterium]
MKLPVAEVQAFLVDRGLDGWLLYDFRGVNPTALGALGLERHLLTRRWFYLVPARGEPTLLVHAIERGSFPHVGGAVRIYAGREAFATELGGLLRGLHKVAMEYCPLGAIPYLSRVDAGIVELVRSLGMEVVSSGDLVQWFLARWDRAQVESHRRASAALDAAREAAFKLVAERARAGQPALETEVQDAMMAEFAQRRCVTDHPPIVAVGPHSADPHYVPTRERATPCKPGEMLLLDLWCKEDDARAVYADITWMAFIGATPAPEHAKVWQVVREGRDVGVEKVRRDHAEGKRIEGWQVDRAVRDHITSAGYGPQFLHRTGHSIGAQSVHGDGANIDDYETHDTRELVPGLAFSIEPGVYLEGRFGVRSELDVFLAADGPHVYTPPQAELVKLLP